MGEERRMGKKLKKKEEGNKDICRNIFFDDSKKVVKRVMIFCTCKRILKIPL
jgi:hypothetical protein